MQPPRPDHDPVRGEAVRGVLLDIDGVLTVSWRPLPGAIRAITALRATGYRIALLTNTTSRGRAEIADLLDRAGFSVDPEEIFTAPVLAAHYLAERYPGARCALLNSGDIAADLGGITLVPLGDPRADVVILGGAGPEFSYEALDLVFSHLQRGARLVAMHRNLFWRTDRGLQLDSGAFITGLERAASVTAEITGKPAAAFFASALDALGVTAAQAVMVGDDIEADVLGAQACGITGILVRTGKYLAEAVLAAPGLPDLVVDSIADVPAALSRPA